jgi:hypothetical protein
MNLGLEGGIGLVGVNRVFGGVFGVSRCPARAAAHAALFRPNIDHDILIKCL